VRVRCGRNAANHANTLAILAEAFKGWEGNSARREYESQLRGYCCVSLHACHASPDLSWHTFTETPAFAYDSPSEFSRNSFAAASLFIANGSGKGRGSVTVRMDSSCLSVIAALPPFSSACRAGESRAIPQPSPEIAHFSSSIAPAALRSSSRQGRGSRSNPSIVFRIVPIDSHFHRSDNRAANGVVAVVS